MGIASFVVGLSCFVLSPFFSVYLILPSILGLIIGIIDTVLRVKKKKSKAFSVTGIVLSSISLIICIFLSLSIYFYSAYTIENEISENNTRHNFFNRYSCWIRRGSNIG